MKLLLTILHLLLATTTYSQINNPGFEKWEWIQMVTLYKDFEGLSHIHFS